MKKLTSNTAGTLLSLFGVLVLSPDTLLISSVRADTWTLIFWRGFLTALTLATAMVVIDRRKFLKKSITMGGPGLVVAMFFAMSTVSFVTSVRLTKAANALVIVAAMPLVAAVFTRVFLREKVPARTWAAVIVGFSGITMVFWGNLGTTASLGDLLALGTALFMAGNFVIIRKYGKVNMLPAVVVSGLVTTVLAGTITNPFSLTAGDVILLGVLGTIVLPIPLAIMTVAPKLIPPAEVGLIMLLETFLGPFWVWLALAERPGIHTVFGGGILVLTLVLHAWAGMRWPDYRDPLLTERFGINNP